MSHSIRIAWIAIRELLYERVFYILICFLAASLGLSLMLGQLTYAEQSKITLDFMLAGMQLSMVLFAIFMGISLFQKELMLGSISMVLSKPISRWSFLLGKFLGQLTVQTVVTCAMGLITALICSRFEENISYLAILQTVMMILMEVAVLTSITYFFAVNSGAITTALVTLSLFGIGHLGDTVSKSVDAEGPRTLWQLVRYLLPDLEIFNMKTLASYGFAITWTEMGWAFAYTLCCLGFFLFTAALCFSRKDILT